MSYRTMSNREGNQQRIMKMHEANMPPNVIAAYMTNWNVPMTAPDVQSIINTYDAMGAHAVKRSDVDQAIKTHQLIEQFNKGAPIIKQDNDSEMINEDVEEKTEIE